MDKDAVIERLKRELATEQVEGNRLRAFVGDAYRTQRDAFAAAALMGLLPRAGKACLAHIAEKAYHMAGAMMMRRKDLDAAKNKEVVNE